MSLRTIMLLAVMATVAATVAAQKPDPDPYTKDEPARMKRAGYVTFAPDVFRPLVQKHAPQTPVLFVETKHFVVGCGLRPGDAPKTSKRRRQFQKELAELRIVLPRVKKNTKRIDAWLQLHLYAHRMERLYDEMQYLLKVTDSDFPKDAKSQRYVKPDKFMGWGPYLGMRGKFRVLLLQNKDELARIETAITGRTAGAGSFHHYDARAGCLIYAACLETYGEQREPAHSLRCEVRFNMAKNLLKGYRYFDFGVPAWLDDGIGNLMLRELDPGKFSFSAIRGGGEPTARNAKWESNTRNLVKNGLATASAKLCVAESAAAFSLNDHMVSWSRLEYIRSLDQGRTLARFLRRIKQPIDSPNFQKILANQEAAFAAALGTTFAEFDAAWGKHVLKRYRRK